MVEHIEVRRGEYHDSVTLMQVSRSAGDVDGVDVALVAMATELNLQLLDTLGFSRAEVDGSGPNDLLVAVRARDDAALAAALAAAEQALTASGSDAADDVSGLAPARTIRRASHRVDANLALVSVPGEHAFVEALDALRAGANVMVFSDNVSLAHEVRLKAEATGRGLIVMGPDCGTAMVGGVGLGFANVVKPGPVGLVAASGTGAQQLMCLLDDAAVGVSHVLGVGGRDLSRDVQAASTLQALAALDSDPATELIVVVSKPPAEEVAAAVRAAAAGLATPCLTAFLGRGQPDLTAVAADVVRALGRPQSTPDWWPAPVERTGTYDEIRGLFAGGTLCDEAMIIASDAVGPVLSNIPLEPAWSLPGDLRADGHVMIDFGDDRLTRGRPHPMIDQRSRLERIADEAARATTRPPAGGHVPAGPVLLLDVVLGHSAHPDPAGELAPALAEAIATAAAGGRDLAVVVSLCAAAGDPQDRDRQAAALVEAGASVHLSNAAATRKAVELVTGDADAAVGHRPPAAPSGEPIA